MEAQQNVQNTSSRPFLHHLSQELGGSSPETSSDSDSSFFFSSHMVLACNGLNSTFQSLAFQSLEAQSMKSSSWKFLLSSMVEHV